uniref:Uncharacterized protein n=1 Tax=Acrobeloides nanus TaxID=290746 RepID=A0A914DQF8_9BILA
MPSNSSESKSDESKEVKERENEDQTTMLPIVLPSLDSVSNETVQNTSAEGNHEDFPIPVVIDLSHETEINHNFNPTPLLVIEPPINRSIIESAKEPTISDQDNTQTGIHKNKTIVEPQRVLMPPLNPTAPENVIKPTQKEPESHIEKVHVAPLARVIRSGKPKPSTSSEKVSAATPIIIGITAITKGQAA